MSATTESREPDRPVLWRREARQVVLTAAAGAVFLAGMATAETLLRLDVIAVTLWLMAAAYAIVACVGAALLPRSRGDRP